MTALVIHPGALGDVLLAVPALRALRAGGETVTVAAQPRIGALLVELAVADRAVAFDTLGLDVLFTDAPLAADAPLARQLADVTRVICWFGAREAQFARRLRALAPGVMIAPATTSTARVWEHLLQTVGGPAERAPIAITAVQMEQGRQTLRVTGWDGVSRVLVVHPGAGGASKRWPVDGFASVVESLDATLVVHQGPADADAVRGFLEHVRRPTLRLIDPPLPRLAAILSTTTAYLGNDSGISHLAASVGAPSVILFTEPARAWLPWSPTAHCLTISTAKVVDAERAAIETALAALL
jgi:ADP-heptose:LPS heptosyltransferase